MANPDSNRIVSITPGHGNHLQVRRHLGRGKWYNMWQVRQSDDQASDDDSTKLKFYPLQVKAIAYGCEFILQKNAAEKVNAAGVKSVCGWLKCDRLYIVRELDFELDRVVKFDPIKSPLWWVNNLPVNSQRIKAPVVCINNKEIFIPKPKTSSLTEGQREPEMAIA